MPLISFSSSKAVLMASMVVFRPIHCAHSFPPGQRPANAVGAGAATARSASTSSRRKVKPPIAPLTPVAPATTLPKKKVLVPIGMGTEEMEAVILVDVLRRAGADVLVASVEAGPEVVASSGTKLVADACIEACSDEIFDLVALPGGMPGAARLRGCEVLREILCKQADKKRLYGAICAAPAIVLQPWGLLKRKHMTCHPAFMDKLPTFWAVKSNIQVSGDLTTSRGPGTTFEFALSLVQQLFGSNVSEEIGGKLLMQNDNDLPRKEEFNCSEWSFDCNPRILVPIANGSEEMEVVMVVDILRRAKADVVVASVEKSTKIVASQNSVIIADKSVSAAAESVYDLIVLPGGVAGAERLHKSRVLRNLLKEQKLAGRVFGAICSSPFVLQRQGLLTNERVTAHPTVINKLTGQVIEGADIVIDGKVITSKGLGTVMNFSLAIVSKLFGHARARSVAEGIVFDYPRN